jgi:hypothetical protein
MVADVATNREIPWDFPEIEQRQSATRIDTNAQRVSDAVFS